jgi:hypothetical protein
MKSSEFIKTAMNLLGSLDGQAGQKLPTGADRANAAALVPAGDEVEHTDNTEPGGVFVPPLQAKIELLKKAVDVDSIYDETGEDGDLTGHGSDNEDELDQLKKLSGINIVALDSMASDEPLDD